MARQRRSFTPEYKDQIARMVVEESRAIPSTAREIGVNEQSLRNWVNAPAGEYSSEYSNRADRTGLHGTGRSRRKAYAP